MSMAGMMSKGDYESKQKVEKRDNERKKNLLILIYNYLINIGLSESAQKLDDESNLELDCYTLADNMDILQILKEYEDYYFMKFSKNPVFSHKINDGKMGGPLPKISGSNRNIKNKPSTNNMKKRVSSKINNQINSQNNKHIDISALNKDSNLQPINQIGQKPDLKLELNIAPFKPTKPGEKKPKNQGVNSSSTTDNTYTFNDHKESILLKPLPSDLPEDLREIASLIKREIILENPNVSFKDIIGLESPKKIIEEALLWPIKYPQLFTGILEPWK